MSAFVLDTFKVSQKLKSHSYSEQQSVGFIEVIQDINFYQLTTKADLAEAKYEIIKWMFGGFFGIVLLVGIMMKLPAI